MRYIGCAVVSASVFGSVGACVSIPEPAPPPPEFTLLTPTAVAFDTAGNRALVVDLNKDALVAIDLDSRNATILPDSETGTGRKEIW